MLLTKLWITAIGSMLFQFLLDTWKSTLSIPSPFLQAVWPPYHLEISLGWSQQHHYPDVSSLRWPDLGRNHCRSEFPLVVLIHQVWGPAGQICTELLDVNLHNPAVNSHSHLQERCRCSGSAGVADKPGTLHYRAVCAGMSYFTYFRMMPLLKVIVPYK